MLVDFYGEVLDVNGQYNYISCDPIEVFSEWFEEEEELDCRKENDSIFCEQAELDYDLLPL